MNDEVSGLPARMLGLAEMAVVAPAEYGGESELLIETTTTLVGFAACGVVARPHGRRTHLVRDIPSGGRPVLLVWRKRLWRCAEPRCPRRTWSETHPEVVARAALVERARRWACCQVGAEGRTVAALAALLGVGWNTVMRAVRDYGQPLIDAPGRVHGVKTLGVDEHVVRHEALLFRMEVKDLHGLVVVAAR